MNRHTAIPPAGTHAIAGNARRWLLELTNPSAVEDTITLTDSAGWEFFGATLGPGAVCRQTVINHTPPAHGPLTVTTSHITGTWDYDED